MWTELVLLHILLHINGWGFVYTCQLMQKKMQQPNAVSLSPFVPHLFQSYCQWLYHYVSFASAFFFFFCFIHKKRISSQYPKGGRLNKRGAVAGFVSYCSFLWADALCSLNVYTEEPGAETSPHALSKWHSHNSTTLPYFVLLSRWTMPR